jgi:hypothetical protein
VPFFAFFWLNSIRILALLQSIPSQFGVTRQYPLLTVSLTLLLTVCMAGVALYGFRVGGEIAAIPLAGVERCPLLLDRAARVLPCLPGVVPMEAKLGKNAGDRRGLLVGELNPNPLPNHFGNLEKARRIAAEQRQQLLGFQCPICPPEGEVNLRSVLSAQLFGSAQEPLFLILFCGSFHGLFFVLCRSSRSVAL